MPDESPTPPLPPDARPRLAVRRRTPRRSGVPAAAVPGSPVVEALPAPGDALRLAIDEELRNQADATMVAATVATLLGTYFGAGGAGYVWIGPSEEILPPPGKEAAGPPRSPGLPPGLHLDSFGPGLAKALRTGRVLAVEDYLADPRLADHRLADGLDPAKARAAWVSIGARALLAAPLVRAGRLDAILYVHGPEPRSWSADDAALLR